MKTTYNEAELKFMSQITDIDFVKRLPILTRKQLMLLGYSANHIQRKMKEATRLVYVKKGC